MMTLSARAWVVAFRIGDVERRRRFVRFAKAAWSGRTVVRDAVVVVETDHVKPSDLWAAMAEYFQPDDRCVTYYVDRSGSLREHGLWPLDQR